MPSIVVDKQGWTAEFISHFKLNLKYSKVKYQTEHRCQQKILYHHNHIIFFEVLINRHVVLIAGVNGCTHFQFQCRTTRECIAVYNACDGIPQCGDGSDEGEDLGCPPGKHHVIFV